MLPSKPCPLCVIPTTVVVFCSMCTKFLINPKTQIMIPIHQSDIERICCSLVLFVSISCLSGYLNMLRNIIKMISSCLGVFCLANINHTGIYNEYYYSIITKLYIQKYISELDNFDIFPVSIISPNIWNNS